MDDFNVTFTDLRHIRHIRQIYVNTSYFRNEYRLTALNKESTLFKNHMNPSFIDLYITNCPNSSENTL